MLLETSPATLDRLLALVRTAHPPRRRCGTKPGTLLETEIPIRTGTWDVSRPGCLEAHSVAHCDASLAGDFIWSLTYTDIATDWTEGRAVWSKGVAGVLAATRHGEEWLPFALRGLDCDNGCELLNHHLLTYLHERVQPVGLHPLASLSQGRSGARRAEELDVAMPTPGLRAAGAGGLVEPISALHAEVRRPLTNFFLPGLKL